MRLSTSAFLVMALAAASAGGQTSLDAEISRGVALRRDGRDEAALRVFQSVYRSSREPRALAQVALAEHALGRWVDAESHLIEALGAARDPWVHTNLAILQSALREIRQHVGRLDVLGEPDGAEVVIDGVVVGTLPLQAMLHVRTGSLTFTVRREGYIPVIRTVQVESRYPLREQVALARVALPVTHPAFAPPAEAHAPARPVDRSHEPGTPALRYVGYGLIGTGVAALAVSGVFVGVNLLAAGEAGSATPTSTEPYGAWARFQASENRSRSGSDQCAVAEGATGADAAQVRDLCARISTSATVALVAGLAGAALLTTGVVLAVVARPAAGSAGAARWSLSPWVASNVGGASLAGTW